MKSMIEGDLKNYMDFNPIPPGLWNDVVTWGRGLFDPLYFSAI